MEGSPSGLITSGKLDLEFKTHGKPAQMNGKKEAGDTLTTEIRKRGLMWPFPGCRSNFVAGEILIRIKGSCLSLGILDLYQSMN